MSNSHKHFIFSVKQNDESLYYKNDALNPYSLMNTYTNSDKPYSDLMKLGTDELSTIEFVVNSQSTADFLAAEIDIDNNTLIIYDSDEFGFCGAYPLDKAAYIAKSQCENENTYMDKLSVIAIREKKEFPTGEKFIDDKFILPKRLFVDMDGTLAEFKEVKELETLYEPGYFKSLKPNESVVAAVKEIITHHTEIEVYIMSAVLSDSKYALDEKKQWLSENLPEISPDKCIFPPCGSDKLDYVPNGIRSDDFLLDDYSRNLNAWEPPARGIKLLNGINGNNGTWDKESISYLNDSKTLADSICRIINENAFIKDFRPQDIDSNCFNEVDFAVLIDEKDSFLSNDTIKPTLNELETWQTKAERIIDSHKYKGQERNI